MPSVKFTQDTFMQARPRYMSLGSILSGTPPGKEMVPLFGRQVDEDLTLTTGTYNLNTTRNKGTTIASVFGLGGQVLTVPGLSALNAATVGQYVYHDTIDRSARIIEVGGGVALSGTTGGTSGGAQTFIIGALSSTATLRVGQYVSSTAISGIARIDQIIDANSVQVSASMFPAISATFTFGSYIGTNKTVLQPSLVSSFTATVQPTRLTRAHDMPFARLSAITANTDLTLMTTGFSQARNFHAGDVVLLINMSGDATNFSNVGNYEFCVVKSTAVLPDKIILRSPLTRILGVGSNANLTGQTVMMYRVPEYSTVTLTGGIVTANPYVAPGASFLYGGVVALMADYVNATTSPAAFQASEKGYSRIPTATPYFDSRVTRDAYLQKLVMGNASSADGTVGGGIVFVAARQIDDVTAASNGSPGPSSNGGAGGSCILISEDIKRTSGISAVKVPGASQPDGVIKSLYRKLGATLANEDADGPGLVSWSTPAGYKQTL